MAAESVTIPQLTLRRYQTKKKKNKKKKAQQTPPPRPQKEPPPPPPTQSNECQSLFLRFSPWHHYVRALYLRLGYLDCTARSARSLSSRGFGFSLYRACSPIFTCLSSTLLMLVCSFSGLLSFPFRRT